MRKAGHAFASARQCLTVEMGVQDPVNNLAPAVLVSAFNVTHLKETEMELQKLRVALQRWGLQLAHSRAPLSLLYSVSSFLPVDAVPDCLAV